MCLSLHIIVLCTQDYVSKLFPELWLEQFLLYMYMYALNMACIPVLECLDQRLHVSIQGAPSWSRSHLPVLPPPLSASLVQNFDFSKAEGPFRRV